MTGPFQASRPLSELLARLDAEDADRREWIERVRTRLGLVTIDGGLPRQRWPELPPGVTREDCGGWMADLATGRTVKVAPGEPFDVRRFMVGTA